MANDGSAVNHYAEVEKLFDASRYRLIRLIEAELFVLAKELETEAQAKAVRALFQRPLGTLNRRFGLPTNASNPHSSARK